MHTLIKNKAKEDDLATKDYAYVAGVCISPMGHILTSSHVVKPDVKYVGACTSWKAGWTPLRVVKTSMAYGMCLFQLEHESRKKTDYTNLAESGVLNVNQHVYGFGHPNLFKIPCDYTFVRGSVEYPCKDISELPSLNDLDSLCSEDLRRKGLRFDRMEAIVLTPRKVKHLMWLIDQSFKPNTIYQMQQDIPLIQIKNFHLSRCGSPVFLSSGHIVGIILFKFHEINFAVHLSAIKEFLKEFDLMPQHVDAPSMAENAVSDQTPTAEPAPASVTTTETVDGGSEQHTSLDALFPPPEKQLGS